MDEIIIDATRLREALRRTAHARAKDPDRPVLMWHWMVPWEHGLDVVTADNYRIARARLTVGVPAGWPTCLLHAADGDLLVAWLNRRGDVTLTLDGDVLVITDREDSVRFRLAEGTPPGYAAVVEGTERTTIVAVNARYLGDAGKAAYSKDGAGIARIVLGQADKPVIVEAYDYTEWIMPVRTPA